MPKNVVLSRALYDMAGNVEEWTWDWWDDEWYGNAEATRDDTRGPTTGVKPEHKGVSRVYRGGNFFMGASFCKCATRMYLSPKERGLGTGFRSVLHAGQVFAE